MKIHTYSLFKWIDKVCTFVIYSYGKCDIVPFIHMKNVKSFMNRNIFKELLKWRLDVKRKPLVLLGARQVGKTYALKKFGEKYFDNIFYVNFETEPQIHSLFKGSLNPYHLVKNLELYYNKTIDSKSTLIIFDEVQESAHALTSLKYFLEEAPEYYIAAAGSLLGLKLKRSKGFPVGKVDFLSLYPLSFFEYLEAIGEIKLAEYLQEIKTIKPLAEPIHERTLELFKDYLYVGGMPEVVQRYTESKSLFALRDIQKAIIKAYEFDFAKHAPPQLITRITEIWHSLPRQLSKENKKFIFSAVRAGARAREYDAAIQWLLDAGLIYRARNVETPKLPLSAYADHAGFKLYMNDTGLLGALSDLSSQTIVEGNKLFVEFKGALIENFVAIALTTQGYTLYYWTSGNTAEVDFIIPYQGEVYPLEVKSGTASKKKSLLVYDERYHPKMLHRISPLNLKHDHRICNFPLYLMERYPLGKVI